MEASGNAEAAEKFNNLAKLALERQIQAEKEAEAAEPLIESQRAVVEKLKDGLNSLRGKLENLKNKRDELVARQKSVQAQNQVHDALAAVNVLDPTSELGRFEDKIRREEAVAAGREEVVSTSLESQFAELEDSTEQAEVAARLEKLKSEDL